MSNDKNDLAAELRHDKKVCAFIMAAGAVVLVGGIATSIPLIFPKNAAECDNVERPTRGEVSIVKRGPYFCIQFGKD